MYFTNEELDQYIGKIKIDHDEYLKSVVPAIIESLRKTPNNYLAFGIYWYHIKKVIQEYSTGDDWFYGDFHDQLIMEMSDHGDDFRNVVAALVYADSTDYFSSSSHTFTWKGDPRSYILEDDNFLFPDDIEKEPATESVKRSGSLKPLESKLEKKYNVKLDIFQFKGGIEFTKLIVPKEERDKGTGSKVMKEVIAFADKNGLVIGVTPSKDFGGTLGRLKKFYKRFGFVDNKGRNRDFSFKTDMIRNPKGEVAMEAIQTTIDFSSALGKPIGILAGQVEIFEKEITKDILGELRESSQKAQQEYSEWLQKNPKAVKEAEELSEQAKIISPAFRAKYLKKAKHDFDTKWSAIYADRNKTKPPIPIEGKLNQGLKDYFIQNGIPEIGTQFENQGRTVTLKEVTPKGDTSDVKMSYQVKGVDKEFPLTGIPVKG